VTISQIRWKVQLDPQDKMEIPPYKMEVPPYKMEVPSYRLEIPSYRTEYLPSAGAGDMQDGMEKASVLLDYSQSNGNSQPRRAS
jgi:hypothetical protein